MVYLEYEKNTMQVVQIHSEEPTLASDDYAIAKADSFKLGDDFEYTIWIQEVDSDKNLVSYSAIRNNPHAKRLLKENDDLKRKNDDLEQAVAELTLLVSMGGL